MPDFQQEHVASVGEFPSARHLLLAIVFSVAMVACLSVWEAIARWMVVFLLLLGGCLLALSVSFLVSILIE